MPFLTEELWSRTPGHVDYVMRAPWPEPEGKFLDSLDAYRNALKVRWNRPRGIPTCAFASTVSS